MGRVKDAQKTALRQVAEKFPHIEFRLTANQNVILANASDADKAAITTLLNAAAVKTENQTTILHAASMACPSLPTCGLGLAESERYLPGLIDRIEKVRADLGLGNEEIIIRSTGCPNGCARPYVAEIAFRRQSAGPLSSLARRRRFRHALESPLERCGERSRHGNRTPPRARAFRQRAQRQRTLRRLVRPGVSEGAIRRGELKQSVKAERALTAAMPYSHPQPVEKHNAFKQVRLLLFGALSLAAAAGL
jgi:hypothetical protein